MPNEAIKVNYKMKIKIDGQPESHKESKYIFKHKMLCKHRYN